MRTLKSLSLRLLGLTGLLVALTHSASAQTADEIIEKYLSAIGGPAALEKLQSRHLSGTLTMMASGLNLSGTVEVFSQVPNKSRTVMKIDPPAGSRSQDPATIDQRFDGSIGFVVDSRQGGRELTGSQLDNLTNGSFPTPFFNYKERGSTVELLRKEPVAGRDADVILLKPKSGPAMQCFFDSESHLLVKMVVSLQVPQLGRELPQTTEYLDYREKDGIKIPFQLKNSSPIQNYTVNVTLIEHNVKLDETMFSKPAGFK